MTRRLPEFCAALAALLCASTLVAHEIGTTWVSVIFGDDQSYEIEIVTDAAALADKLQASAGETVATETDPARLQALLERFDARFRQRVKVAFDATDARPAIAYSVASGTDSAPSAVATIRLTGRVPASARLFTWNYAWTFASYALTVRGPASANPVTEWLEGGQSSARFQLAAPAPPVDRLGVAWLYLTLGFTHILPHGLDHMLFVLGIYLLSGRARSVLWQVSAFTIAHSITLGLGMYGLVSVSPRIVEPLIALSIAYVAIENIFLSELKSWRVAVVFCFGLLHGLGFAGALRQLGLPRTQFVTALFSFNAGVELGQVAVIGAAFLLFGWHCAQRAWYRPRVVVPVSALIACTAVYWTIVRL